MIALVFAKMSHHIRGIHLLSYVQICIVRFLQKN